MARYEVAGSLQGGRKVWILARLPYDFEVTKGDEIRSYLLLTTSHDGSLAFQIYRHRFVLRVGIRCRLVCKVEIQKNQEVSRIPLNQTAIEILLETKRNATDEQPFSCNFRKAFETAVRRAGIKDFSFHCLRHAFASWLVMAGIPIYTVKELMRHKDFAMTMRYAHLSPDHKREAVKVLESSEDFQQTLNRHQTICRIIGNFVSR